MVLEFNSALSGEEADRKPSAGEALSEDELDENLRRTFDALLDRLFAGLSRRAQGDVVTFEGCDLLLFHAGRCVGDAVDLSTYEFYTPLMLIRHVREGLSDKDAVEFAQAVLSEQTDQEIVRFSITELWENEDRRVRYLIENGFLSFKEEDFEPLVAASEENSASTLDVALGGLDKQPDRSDSIRASTMPDRLRNLLEVKPNALPQFAHQLRIETKENATKTILQVSNDFWSIPKVDVKEYSPELHKRRLLSATVGSGKTTSFLENILPHATDIRRRFDRPVNIDLVFPTLKLMNDVHQKLSVIANKLRSKDLSIEVIPFYSRGETAAKDGGPLCKRGPSNLKPIYDQEDIVTGNFCEREGPHREEVTNTLDFNIQFGEGAFFAGKPSVLSEAAKGEVGILDNLRTIAKCPHHHTCEYTKQYDRAKFEDRDFVFRLYTHAAGKYAWPLGVRSADYVIVDEGPSSTFVVENSDDPFDLTLFRKGHMFQKRMGAAARGGSDVDRYGQTLFSVEKGFLACFRNLSQRVQMHGKNRTLDTVAWQNSLQEIKSQNGLLDALRTEGVGRDDIEFLWNADHENIVPQFGDPSEDTSQILKKQPKHNLISKKLKSIWEALLLEIDVEEPHSRQFAPVLRHIDDYEASVEEKFILTQWIRDNNPEFGLLDELGRRSSGRFSEAREKLIVLDATPRAEELAAIFGPFDSTQVKFPHRAEIFVDHSRSYSKTALTSQKFGKELRARIWEAIDQIASQLGPMGFVALPLDAKKALLADRQIFVPDEGAEGRMEPIAYWNSIAFLHQGALKGLDTFVDHSWGIVVGGSRIEEGALYRQIRSLYADAEIDVSPKKRMVSPETTVRVESAEENGFVETTFSQGLSLPGFKDPRLHEAYTSFYESSIIQSAGRLRTVHSKQRKRLFFFASGIPDEFVADWLEEGTRHHANQEQKEIALEKFSCVMRRTQGVFVLQPDWLVETAPDLFGTRSAAKDWLKNHRDELRGTPIIKNIPIAGTPPNLTGEGHQFQVHEGHATLRKIVGAGRGAPPRGDVLIVAKDQQSAALAAKVSIWSAGFLTTKLQFEAQS